MYYEHTETGWKANHKKSALFNGSTYPIEIVPPEFWNSDRKESAEIPVYNHGTEKLSGLHVLKDGTVGHVVVALSSEELQERLHGKRSMMVVTPWQFMKVLNLKSHRVLVEATVNQSGQDVIDGWQRASSFDRLDPMVVSLGAALGMSDQYLDELFELAATL